MNRRFFQTTRRSPRNMEIELVRQNYSQSNSFQYSPSNPILPRFRRNRHLRLLSTTESDVSEAVSTNLEHVPCDFCHNLVFASSYDQHLTCCPIKLELQRENRLPNIPIFHLEDGSQSQNILNSDNSFDDIPDNIPVFHLEGGSESQHIPESEDNFLTRDRDRIFESPVSQPMIPEAQDYPSQEPPSLFASLSNEVPSALEDIGNTDNVPSLIPQNEESDVLNNNAQEQESQDIQIGAVPGNGNENERQAPGTLVIRTIESGDDGSTIVRMRAIPLDRIFGRQEQNTGEGENNNAEPPNILRLLSILAGLQGMRAAHFADFLSFLHAERGLDKEVLDSLPVVAYTNEGFKNVDEESKRCTICLDNYEEEQEVKFLWCMHRFHKGCVDQWLNSHTNCPFCKKDYSEAIRNYEGSQETA